MLHNVRTYRRTGGIDAGLFLVRMYAAIYPKTLRIWKSAIAGVQKRSVFEAVF